MGDSRGPEDDFSDVEVPENENLDRESLFSENLIEMDSPVDGYFATRDHPQDTYVQNSSVQAEADAKAREAARERASSAQPSGSTVGASMPRSNYHPPSVQSSDSQPSHSAPAWESQPTAQLEAEHPPPDYMTAISDSQSSGRASQVSHSPTQSHASAGPANYGTMNSEESRLPWPLGPQGNPFAGGHDNPWPFGSRGNPFGGGSNAAWPFGERGNPFVSPNYPFGPGTTFWNPQGFSAQVPRGTPSSQGRSQVPSGQGYQPASPSYNHAQAPSDMDRSLESLGEQSEASFGQDHPLVRNGLLSESNAFNNRPEPQSMSDARAHPAPSANEADQGRVYVDDGELHDEESALIAPRQRRGSRRNGHSASHYETLGGRSTGNTSSVWRSTKRNGRSCVSWCTRICWLIVIALLALVVCIIALTRGTGSASNGKSNPNTEFERPVTDPTTGEPVAPPPFPSPGYDALCQWGDEKRILVNRDTPSKLALLETMKVPDDRRPYRISGEIKISAGDSNQKEDTRFWVYMQSSEGYQIDNINFDEIDGGIKIHYPDITPVDSDWRRYSCLWLGVHIQVRPDLDINDLEIDTAHLKVSSDEELFGYHHGTTKRKEQGLQILNAASITTRAGKISLPYWTSRETYIKSDSGRVSGTYSLLDLLDIQTSSATIDVDVSPKEVDPDRPKPAQLSVHSSSGHSTIRMPTSGDIPTRDYKSRVETSSGGISGSYIFESNASFSTNSGTINLDVLPFSSAAEELRTYSSSSTHKLNVLSPFSSESSESISTASKTELSGLKSSHQSSSGTIKVEYPREWTGVVRAESMSGSIHLRGKDVQKSASQTTLPVGSYKKSLVARKGEGNSEVYLNTMSATIDILVGNE